MRLPSLPPSLTSQLVPLHVRFIMIIGFVIKWKSLKMICVFNLFRLSLPSVPYCVFFLFVYLFCELHSYVASLYISDIIYFVI